jgi:hypothetical protein
LIVFGTTTSCRNKMYETFIPASWRGRVKWPRWLGGRGRERLGEEQGTVVVVNDTHLATTEPPRKANSTTQESYILSDAPRSGQWRGKTVATLPSALSARTRTKEIRSDNLSEVLEENERDFGTGSTASGGWDPISSPPRPPAATIKPGLSDNIRDR